MFIRGHLAFYYYKAIVFLDQTSCRYLISIIIPEASQRTTAIIVNAIDNWMA